MENSSFKVPSGMSHHSCQSGNLSMPVQESIQNSASLKKSSEGFKKTLMKKKVQISSQKEVVLLFENKNFVFLPFGLELTPLRIKILTEHVEKRGGKVLPYSKTLWSADKKNDMLILISKEMTFQAVQNLVPTILHGEIQRFNFIDCEWITQCLQRKELVNLDTFYIKLKEPFSDTQAFQEDKTIENTCIADEPLYDNIEHNPSNKENEMVIEQNSQKKVALLHTSSFEFLESDIPQQKVETNSQIEKQRMFVFQEDASSQTKYEAKHEIKNETKNEFIKIENQMKKKLRMKKEEKLKFEENQRNFTYILSDNDDEVAFVGKTLKKIKFEEDNVQGTVLEGIQDLEKINTDNNGEVVELKQFRTFKGLKRLKEKVDRAGKTNGKGGKEEIYICRLGMKENLNSHITDELEVIWKAYEVLRDEREVGYGRIISILKTMPKITSVKDVEGICGLGKKMIKKVSEILKTGKLRKSEAMRKDEKLQTLLLFNSIWGVGPATAYKFYQQGFRSIEDLRKNPQVLTEWQVLGLKYHEDFQLKIPRESVYEMFEMIQGKIELLSTYKKEYEAICGGSYRRGRKMCSDLDIVMSRRDEKPVIGFLAKLLKSLEGILLVEHITWPSPESNGGESYMGVCCWNGIYRRIDIRIYPRDQFGPAICFFTGSEWFNRSMKLLAKRKGLNLENYGLYPAIRMKDTKISLQCIPCHTEEEVFKNLNLKYIPPEERDI